jgi:hypothetical protein
MYSLPWKSRKVLKVPLEDCKYAIVEPEILPFDGKSGANAVSAVQSGIQEKTCCISVSLKSRMLTKGGESGWCCLPNRHDKNYLLLMPKG